jgi:hypothetical protein
MKGILILFITLTFFCNKSVYGQNDDSLFSRLRGVSNNGATYFNVDGVEISMQTSAIDFTKSNILKHYKRYSIKESDLNVTDSLVVQPNFYVFKSKETSNGIVENASCYFIQQPNKGLLFIIFTSLNKKDRSFERQFVHLVQNNAIPDSVFESLQIDSINFAGRKIKLGGSCHWMGVNNVQCPSYGQMNWSMNKSLVDAATEVNNQYLVIKGKKQGRVVSEESVDVIFEGTAIKAKKVIYDFKGVRSLMLGMTGGKTLTIYFVASPVRQHFVSCVMSFWNNDVINPSGLPPLLEQVMQVKK